MTVVYVIISCAAIAVFLAVLAVSVWAITYGVTSEQCFEAARKYMELGSEMRDREKRDKT